ncbi:hypothetical protein CEV31_1404 [Brucella thiophenivorans]|uniref:Uncharacterized protein n=1 Tax=Brucella thiophenivorans TaxID=571255 RepID=A0A256FYQ4_9HYPH|nr:hypothetical protein CEV31_1404 [Brucella thiophenivorans]
MLMPVESISGNIASILRLCRNDSVVSRNNCSEVVEERRK